MVEDNDQERKEIVLPKTKKSLKQYRDVYADHLLGDQVDVIAERYNLARSTIYNIVSTMARYCDLGLDTDEKIQIAIAKCNRRITNLTTLCEEARAKQDFRATAQLMKEIRMNNELEYRLQGLLKIEVNQNNDNRKMVVIHNMGPNDKESLTSVREGMLKGGAISPEAQVFEPIIEDHGKPEKNVSRETKEKPDAEKKEKAKG